MVSVLLSHNNPVQSIILYDQEKSVRETDGWETGGCFVIRDCCIYSLYAALYPSAHQTKFNHVDKQLEPRSDCSI